MISESHHAVIMTTLKNVTYCKKQETVFCDQIVEKILYHLFELYFHFCLHSVHTKRLQPRLGLLHIMYLPKHTAALFTRACHNRTWEEWLNWKGAGFFLEEILYYEGGGAQQHHPEKLQMPHPGSVQARLDWLWVTWASGKVSLVMAGGLVTR